MPVEGSGIQRVYKITVIFLSESTSFLSGQLVTHHGMLCRELGVDLGSEKVAQWVVWPIKCQYDTTKFRSDLELRLICFFN
jgi:hypothetical protein